MKALKILRILGRLYPVAVALVDAIDRASEGGKKITRTEWQAIGRAALGTAEDVIDEIGAEVVR